MPSVTANGLTIEYESFGVLGDPAICLIMGLGTQMIAWPDAFCDALAAQGFCVLRFDNRDCGLSTKLEHLAPPGSVSTALRALVGARVKAPYSLADMAADTLGLMDALSVTRAHIVGVSMGGMIAQHLAARYPERVLSLTSWMSTSGAPGLPRPAWRVSRHLFLKRPASNDRAALIAHLVKTLELIGSPGYAQDYRPLAEAAVARSVHPDGFRRQLAAIIADGSRRALLNSIRVPTLVVHGDSDPLIPLAGGRDTAQHIPGARLEVIKGLGHDLPNALMGDMAELIGAHCRDATAANLA